MKNNMKILDTCCGSKMFWFNKKHENVVFGDIRQESHTLCDGRKLVINPDVRYDFRNLPFRNSQFKLIVFDPPHLKNVGEFSYMALKYGILKHDWESSIKLGFDECMRCLSQGGTLIFKWNETQIKLSKIIDCIATNPLFGHVSGRASKTIWMCFLKND